MCLDCAIKCCLIAQLNALQLRNSIALNCTTHDDRITQLNVFGWHHGMLINYVIQFVSIAQFIMIELQSNCQEFRLSMTFNSAIQYILITQVDELPLDIQFTQTHLLPFLNFILLENEIKFYNFCYYIILRK